jgi:type I restriction enzyme R subunit
VRDDVETLILDAEALDSILKDANPEKKAHEITIKLVARLRKHAGDPRFKELGERLEKIKDRQVARQIPANGRQRLIAA